MNLTSSLYLPPTPLNNTIVGTLSASNVVPPLRTNYTFRVSPPVMDNALFTVIGSDLALSRANQTGNNLQVEIVGTDICGLSFTERFVVNEGWCGVPLSRSYRI